MIDKFSDFEKKNLELPEYPQFHSLLCFLILEIKAL